MRVCDICLKKSVSWKHIGTGKDYCFDCFINYAKDKARDDFEYID